MEASGDADVATAIVKVVDGKPIRGVGKKPVVAWQLLRYKTRHLPATLSRASAGHLLSKNL